MHDILLQITYKMRMKILTIRCTIISDNNYQKSTIVMFVICKNIISKNIER